MFIVGYCPDFINRDVVTFIKCHDEFDCKHKNIMHCLETAIEKADISDDFLYSSDDHFYIKPADFGNYPYYRKSLELPNKPEGNSYEKCLTYTRKILLAAGLTAYNFSWHGNTHFNKTMFLSPQFEAMRALSYDMPRGCEPTCLMLNYMLAHRPFEIVDREDNKLPALATKEMFAKGFDRECISCASNIDGSYLQTFLALNFPNKSKYEK